MMQALLGSWLTYSDAAVGAIGKEALAISVSCDGSNCGEDDSEDGKLDHFVVWLGRVVKYNLEMSEGMSLV